MASHPYISGAGNITQMVAFLRKNFPATVTSDTVKKLGLASNNESYVINALQFLGIIDEEGKRTARGQEILATHNEEAFQKSFAALVKEAYKDLFELRGEDAWTIDRDDLIGYFRSADKTSDVIGTRQAGVFQALRALAGHDAPTATQKSATPKPGAKVARSKTSKAKDAAQNPPPPDPPVTINRSGKKNMALTVRIEINLPAEASAETYNNIFKSIKANLLNE